MYETTPAFERPIHISAEYTEHDQLKISFLIEDSYLDLTTLNDNDISFTYSTTPVAVSQSNYFRPIDDDNYNGWVGLTNGQIGDAYIYGGFLGENSIDMVENGKKINGWKISLFTHGISIALFVRSNQYSYYYNTEQITTYEGAPTIEWPVQITTEFTENGELIVSFFVEDYAFDLTSLYKMTIENCYEEIW